MEIRQIDKDFAVTGQITAADVPAIAKAGFASLVCNRPDTEAGAVPHGEIDLAAARAGLQFHFLPVVSGQITPQNVADMKTALAELPRPVLAYCRSGARCANLYMLVNQARA
jgi:uncharacterized protein (TIGR01244 family)